jgi:hypothetical protein
VQHYCYPTHTLAFLLLHRVDRSRSQSRSQPLVCLAANPPSAELSPARRHTSPGPAVLEVHSFRLDMPSLSHLHLPMLMPLKVLLGAWTSPIVLIDVKPRCSSGSSRRM